MIDHIRDGFGKGAEVGKPWQPVVKELYDVVHNQEGICMSDNVPCVRAAIADPRLRTHLERALKGESLIELMVGERTAEIAHRLYTSLRKPPRQDEARWALRDHFGSYHHIQESGIESCLRLLAAELAKATQEAVA